MKRYLFILFSFVLLSSMQCSNHSIEASGSTTVYVTTSGKKYHVQGCSSLRKSSIPLSLSEAVEKGYLPCLRCHPPVMTK